MNTRIWKCISVLTTIVMIAGLILSGSALATDPTPLEQTLAGAYTGTTVAVGSIYGDSWLADYKR